MAQYFTYDATLPSDVKQFSYYFGSEPFTFWSDSGLFSTGHMDPATACLLAHIVPFSGSLLDLGCGWGAVGVVLAKAYGLKQVTMSDINQKALEYAEKNCAHNGVSATLVLSDGFEKIQTSFDVIVLNPPIHAGKQTVFRLYAQSREHLNPGGAFYVVIQKKHGAQSSIQQLTALFGNCEILHRKKGCFVLRCTGGKTDAGSDLGAGAQ